MRRSAAVILRAAREASAFNTRLAPVASQQPSRALSTPVQRRQQPTKAPAAAPSPAQTETSAGEASKPSSDSTDPSVDPEKGGTGFFGALLYGSKSARELGSLSSQGQHSKIVGRGKYVHKKITHAVIPSHRAQYLEAAEAYYTTLTRRSAELGGVKLTGSWETVIGNVGEFTHILEYEGHKGLDETMRRARKDPEMQSLLSAILPHITSRQHQIVSEFSFWPSSPPRDSGFPDGGVFEMRTYALQPGKLLEWEGAWRRGLEARRRFVQPVGAFFAQVGQLHEVHHIWQYPDMEARKQTRDQAWSVGSWSDTVQETVKLAQSMKTAILVPCTWSPLR